MGVKLGMCGFLLNLCVQGTEGYICGGGVISFRRAECFLQLICFVANLEVFSTTVEIKWWPLAQLVSCI